MGKLMVVIRLWRSIIHLFVKDAIDFALAREDLSKKVSIMIYPNRGRCNANTLTISIIYDNIQTEYSNESYIYNPMVLCCGDCDNKYRILFSLGKEHMFIVG